MTITSGMNRQTFIIRTNTNAYNPAARSLSFDPVQAALRNQNQIIMSVLSMVNHYFEQDHFKAPHSIPSFNQ